MTRLTMDDVNAMGMYAMAHNCCYLDEEKYTRYRDFEMDVDARELVKNLMIAYDVWEPEVGAAMTEDEEAFGEAMFEYLTCELTEIEGLIARFYHMLWAMAQLRERLKRYEDLEEQGRSRRCPAKGVWE